MLSQEDQEERFVHVCFVPVYFCSMQLQYLCMLLYMSEWGYVIAILQDDDGGMDEEYDDAWVQVHKFYLTLK